MLSILSSSKPLTVDRVALLVMSLSIAANRSRRATTTEDSSEGGLASDVPSALSPASTTTVLVESGPSPRGRVGLDPSVLRIDGVAAVGKAVVEAAELAHRKVIRARSMEGGSSAGRNGRVDVNVDDGGVSVETKSGTDTITPDTPGEDLTRVAVEGVVDTMQVVTGTDTAGAGVVTPLDPLGAVGRAVRLSGSVVVYPLVAAGRAVSAVDAVGSSLRRALKVTGLGAVGDIDVNDDDDGNGRASGGDRKIMHLYCAGNEGREGWVRDLLHRWGWTVISLRRSWSDADSTDSNGDEEGATTLIFGSTDDGTIDEVCSLLLSSRRPGRGGCILALLESEESARTLQVLSRELLKPHPVDSASLPDCAVYAISADLAKERALLRARELLADGYGVEEAQGVLIEEFSKMGDHVR